MHSRRAVIGDTRSSRDSCSTAVSSQRSDSQIRSAFGKSDVPHRAPFVVASLQTALGLHGRHAGERPAQRRIEQRGGQLVVGVRAAARLGHDLVHELEPEQVGGA